MVRRDQVGRFHGDGERAARPAFAIIVIVFVGLLVGSPLGRAQDAAPAMTRPAEVAVMGMIHGRHRTSERWGLAAIRDVVRRFRPDVVCAEIPPDRWPKARTDWLQRGVIEDARVKRFPEYVDVLLPLMKEMSFVVEPCAAWTTEMNLERRARIREFESDPKFAERAALYRKRNAELAVRPEVKATDTDDPRFIHSAAYDRGIELELGPYDEFLNDHIGLGGWSNINDAHMRLVHAAIRRHPGKRVLVTFGAGHKYMFLRSLRKREDIRLMSLLPYLAPSRDDSLAVRAHREVEELHRFFEDWYRGRLANDDAAFERFSGVLGEGFEIVWPSGERSPRPSLITRLRGAWGSDRKATMPMEIVLRNVRTRPVGANSILVSYEEWHRRGDKAEGRISSALLREAPRTPNGVEWLHVHETSITERR